MATFERLRTEIAQLEEIDGVTPVEILSLPAALHRAFRQMVKRALTAQELASELQLSLAEAQQVAELLVEKGFLKKSLLKAQPEANGPGPAYRVQFARMRKHDIPLDL